MGLERITAIKKGTLSNYDTDVFALLLEAIANEVGPQDVPAVGIAPDSESRKVKPDVRDLATAMSPFAISSRVVADHLRAMTFLIADGVLPSNEWRGYVLRKIMRRAMRHGKRLGATAPFLHRLVDVLVAQMGDAYPELREGRDTIVRVIRAEEDRFDVVLSAGLPKLEELLEAAAAAGSTVPGDEAFKLYDTFGLPLDFIEDLASERKLTLDRQAFDRAMEAQREKARAKSAFDRKGDEFAFGAPTIQEDLRAVGDRFEGYTTTDVAGAKIVALFDDQKRQVAELLMGATGYVALDRTPFYVEAGGQVSDTGTLQSDAGVVLARVDGVVRLGPGLPRGHHVQVTGGPLSEGQQVRAIVDAPTRDATRRNHTATHLLHAALRQVLGTHVKQAGSLVAPDRLRFDFTHFAALTPAEIESIERIVNEQICGNAEVTTEVRNTEEAMAAGAMALFGEKYGERVRVVTIPGFSVELCGGTHTRATGDIGFFTITEESGVAAGVRRIEAQTGAGAVREHQARRAALRQLLGALNANEALAPDAIAKLQQETRRLAREVHELKVKAALGGGASSEGGDVEDVAGVKAIFRKRRRPRQRRAARAGRLVEGEAQVGRRGPGVAERGGTRRHRRVGHARSQGPRARWQHRQGAGANRRRRRRRAPRLRGSRRPRPVEGRRNAQGRTRGRRSDAAAVAPMRGLRVNFCVAPDTCPQQEFACVGSRPTRNCAIDSPLLAWHVSCRFYGSAACAQVVVAGRRHAQPLYAQASSCSGSPSWRASTQSRPRQISTPGETNKAGWCCRSSPRRPASRCVLSPCTVTTRCRTTGAEASTMPLERRMQAAVADHAARHALDPDLVRAVIRVESGWNPRAVLQKGRDGADAADARDRGRVWRRRSVQSRREHPRRRRVPAAPDRSLRWQDGAGACGLQRRAWRRGEVSPHRAAVPGNASRT